MATTPSITIEQFLAECHNVSIINASFGPDTPMTTGQYYSLVELGQLLSYHPNVPEGFAITICGYRCHRLHRVCEDLVAYHEFHDLTPAGMLRTVRVQGVYTAARVPLLRVRGVTFVVESYGESFYALSAARKRLLQQGIEPNPGPLQPCPYAGKEVSERNGIVNPGPYGRNNRITVRCPLCFCVVYQSGATGNIHMLSPVCHTMKPTYIPVQLKLTRSQDDLEAMGLATAPLPPPVPLAPARPPPPVPAPDAPRAPVHPAPEVPGQAPAAPPLPLVPPSPLYSDSRPPRTVLVGDDSGDKFVPRDDDVVKKSSRRVLDGRRLENEEASAFARSLGYELVSNEVKRVQYMGEQRPVTNRNVKEVRQDFVVQRMVMTTNTCSRTLLAIFAAVWCVQMMYYFAYLCPRRVFGLLWPLIPGITAASFIINCTKKSPLVIKLQLLIMTATLRFSMPIVIDGVLMLYTYSPILPFVLEILDCFIGRVIPTKLLPRSKNWHIKLFGVVFPCTRRCCVWFGLWLLSHGLPHPLAMLCVSLCTLVSSPIKAKYLLKLGDLFFPGSTKTFVFCPHMVTCCMAEYSNGTDAEALASNTRSKLLRLACLPVPDRVAAALLAGSEEVVKYLVPKEPFFEDVETAAWSPL